MKGNMAESRFARKTRLLAEGRWDSFTRRRVQLQESKKYADAEIVLILDREFGAEHMPEDLAGVGIGQAGDKAAAV